METEQNIKLYRNGTRIIHNTNKVTSMKFTSPRQVIETLASTFVGAAIK